MQRAGDPRSLSGALGWAGLGRRADGVALFGPIHWLSVSEIGAPDALACEWPVSSSSPRGGKIPGSKLHCRPHVWLIRLFGV
jgi:hypothetical protein